MSLVRVCLTKQISGIGYNISLIFQVRQLHYRSSNDLQKSVFVPSPFKFRVVVPTLSVSGVPRYRFGRCAESRRALMCYKVLCTTSSPVSRSHPFAVTETWVRIQDELAFPAPESATAGYI